MQKFAKYDLTLCSGSPALTGSASVLVVIDDHNEYAPKFRPAVYRTAIAEDAALGTEVVTVTAFDEDAGEFGVVRLVLRCVLLDLTKSFKNTRA